MKNLLINALLLFVICFYSSCNSDDDDFHIISGQIIHFGTNVGAPAVKLRIKTYKTGTSYNIFGGGGLSSTTIEEKYINTDQNGNFSLTMAKNRDVVRVSIQSLDDGNFVGRYKDFQINDLQNIIIAVYKFETLKIIVKNVNPFNANDKIQFSPPSNFFVKRENFGVLNEVVIESNGNIKQIDQWIGVNVNSAVTYKVPQYYSGYLYAVKTKNNLETAINIVPLTILPNQINIININY